MNKVQRLGSIRPLPLLAFVLAFIFLACLLLYRLGNLAGGLSYGETQAATSAVGWHGIYHSPLYLPLKIVRSVVFYLWPNHGQTLTRLPNAFFGGLAIMAFVALIRLWHSLRIAMLTGLLFATSAWVLHVSRLASFDVIYLWGSAALLLTNALIYRYYDTAWVWYGSLIIFSLLLYVPGMIWLIAINAFFLRRQLKGGWQHFSSLWKRALSIFAIMAWLPLLVLDLTRQGELLQWLGLPHHLPGARLLAQHFLQVPFNLFIHGPKSSSVWLGRAPILDIFSLVVCLLGIYFYLTHLRAGRSRLLISFAIVSWILSGLTGSVGGLSLLVPLLYVAAATGIAYLLHEWLHVFPLNPLARGLGLSLVSVAVALACIYNLRAYFVAWPHSPTTSSTFHYHR